MQLAGLEEAHVAYEYCDDKTSLLNVYLREVKKPSKDAIAKQQAKGQSNVGGGGFGGNGPKKDDDKKERKKNDITKPEAAKLIKDRYEPRSDGKYYLRGGKKGILDDKGKEIKVLKFDHTHNDWEAYTHIRCDAGDHTGSMDPRTFEIYKDGLPNRFE
jgi:hypothetical protein